MGQICIENLELQFAIQSYGFNGNMSIIYSLNDLIGIQEQDVLRAYISVIIGDMEIAQKYFLKCKMYKQFIEILLDIDDLEKAQELALQFYPQKIL